jgi:dTDP-4-amino-4,6-dideoxygalactose transaminase
VKLRHLKKWNESRQAHARLYEEYLEPIEEVAAPETAENRQHVFSLYVIRCEQRDRLRSFLDQRGISTEINYPIPLHRQPACTYLGYKQGAFPKAEDAATKILSLPMYPELKDDEIALVCEGIRDYYRTNL